MPRIALVQHKAESDRWKNMDRALEAMGVAAEMGAEIVSFAELAIDRFFPQRADDPTAADLAEAVPGPLADAVAARAYDSSPVFDADGRLLGVTRMVHITDYNCFHEQAYYAPGDRGAPVYDTRAGRIGVAICYDRHYPEYMRALGVAGAELVVIPQAGAVGEWPEGLYEAEVRTAAFQNGYYAALCNRVGREDDLTFAGESFVVDPEGRVIARGASSEEDLVLADLDFAACRDSTARRLFWRDRRPDLYASWLD
jgi:N-carbamoylputrescine amidase